MENTLENKEKFVAQYWGQKVGMVFDTDWDKHLSYGIGTNCLVYQVDYLELKPLSSISDEDAIEVSKLCVNGDDKRIENIKVYARIYALQSALINDFLRSRGYALPWMGLSVEKLIKYGWIKLKED